MDIAPPLYDLTPTVQVMLTGLLIASGPLLWLWLRHRGTSPIGRLHALTLLTLFLTFDLVLFGAFTRLTDSGLGCPDWPGCYGHASPLGAQGSIAAAQAAMPSGPVTHGKAWVEMMHRYLATGVGVMILVLTVCAWLLHRRRLRGALGAGADSARHPDVPHPAWPTVTLAWVALQGAFGALTVTMKLFPAIVVMHLAGGIALLALLCIQAARHTLAAGRGLRVALPVAAWRAVQLALAMVALQVLLGGWVSTNYAVLACAEFPKCQGSWWPAMDWRHAFELWRPLGTMADGSPIGFATLTAIHYAHRLFAYAVFVVLAALAWYLHRFDGLRRPARWLAGLTLLQAITGISNVVLGWPLAAAVAHTGGAAALVVTLTWIACLTRRDRRQLAQPTGELTVEREVPLRGAAAAQVHGRAAALQPGPPA